MISVHASLHLPASSISPPPPLHRSFHFAPFFFFLPSLLTLSTPIGCYRRPPAYSVTDIIRFGRTALACGTNGEQGGGDRGRGEEEEEARGMIAE